MSRSVEKFFADLVSPILPAAIDRHIANATAAGLELLTAKQAAKLLGISPNTFRRLGLPTVHFGPKSTRYRLADVKAEIEKRKTKPKQRR